MRTIPQTSGPIYVTRPDYERLQQLVRQERQRTGNRQVADLENELKRAQLVSSDDVLPDVVTMNSRVRLRDTASRHELEITLVWPQYADVRAGKISILAPVGTAVLGCRLGDRIVWPLPEGEAMYWVEAILHQPEASQLRIKN